MTYAEESTAAYVAYLTADDCTLENAGFALSDSVARAGPVLAKHLPVSGMSSAEIGAIQQLLTTASVTAAGLISMQHGDEVLNAFTTAMREVMEAHDAAHLLAATAASETKQ